MIGFGFLGTERNGCLDAGGFGFLGTHGSWLWLFWELLDVWWEVLALRLTLIVWELVMFCALLIVWEELALPTNEDISW